MEITYYSLENHLRSSKQYIVNYADWAIDGEKSPPWDSQQEAVCSTDIDTRTIRVRFFDTHEEALQYAKRIIAERGDDKWLAYVEIKKCDIEIVTKLK